MSQTAHSRDDIGSIALASVADHLSRFFSRKHEQLSVITPEAADLVDTLREYMEGGKLLRPRFAIWGGVATQASIPRQSEIDALGAIGAAVELVQAAALLHDDVIDHSPTRRGRPAVHVAAAQEHRQFAGSGSSEDYGVAVAIVLGDLALSWAEELFATEIDISTNSGRRAWKEFSALRTEVMAGQFLDIAHQAGGYRSAQSPHEAAMAVMRWKTVPYTVLRPVRCGAAALGADDATLDGLEAWAVLVGNAFQLRDDLLSVIGDPDVTGKPLGGDIAEGKRTLIVAYAREVASPEQQRVLDEALGVTDLSPEGIARACSVLRETGATARVARDVENLAHQARDVLNSIDGLHSLGRTELQKIADSATTLEGLSLS